VADAERLRRHLQGQIRAATEDQTTEDRAGEHDGMLDVVVVGGGPTGVETTGALVELMAALEATAQTPYAGRITLVDRGDALLGAFADKAHTYAHHKLTTAGAEIRLGVGVAAVHRDRVELTDGSTIPARTVVWGGGESAALIAQGAGPTPGRGGRIDVLPDLSVDGYPGVYAVGDVANIPSADGEPLPQLGSVAQQSGVWAAQNILRDRGGGKTEPFHYKDKGIMAMIGRKTDAFMTWAWDYFDRDHAATIEASSDPRRIAWGDRETDLPHIAVEEPTPSTTSAQT
jgi:NADH dehydrogenase